MKLELLLQNFASSSLLPLGTKQAQDSESSQINHTNQNLNGGMTACHPLSPHHTVCHPKRLTVLDSAAGAAGLDRHHTQGWRVKLS